MSKFIVAVFPSESKAYDGVREFSELHDEGSITLYGYAVVERTADGRIEVMDRNDDFPAGTGVGALTGGLIGLVGGPVGAAVGMGGGALLGAMRDVVNLGITDDFLEKVSTSLGSGKVAVVAEVAEEWVTPLDSRMEALGGTVMREFREDFIDDQLERNINNLKTEVERRREEHAQARAEKKLEKLEAQLARNLEKAEGRLQDDAAEARARMGKFREEIVGKIGTLEAQLKAREVSPETAKRIDHRISELRNDLGRREQKLEQAFELTNEVLGV